MNKPVENGVGMSVFVRAVKRSARKLGMKVTMVNPRDCTTQAVPPVRSCRCGHDHSADVKAAKRLAGVR